MAKQNKTSTKATRTAREEATAARAAAQAAEKRRQRIINITIALVIGAIVVGIVGGALYFSNKTKEEAGGTPDPDAALPVGAFPSGDPLAYGIPYGSNPDAPTLETWEDFQCPACASFEAAVGQDLWQRADNGEIQLVTRVTSFLDRSMGTSYSRLAGVAYGCAVDAGKGMEYKSTVFANHPAKEGDGWTDDQLIGFAETAGISGDDLDTFEQCFSDRVYLPWVTNSTEEFYNNQISGTPTVLINGQKVATADVMDPVKLQGLIDAAAAAE